MLTTLTVATLHGQTTTHKTPPTNNPTIALTLADAFEMAATNNHSIALSNNNIEIAKAEKRVIESSWYPSIIATAEASHTTTPVEVRTTIGEMTNDAVDDLAGLFDDYPLAEMIIEQIGASELGLTLLPRNCASLGLELVWPLFSGGKRLVANRIGCLLVSLAETEREVILGRVQSEIVAAYFGVSLAEEVVAMRERTVVALQNHLRQTELLHREGLITHSEELVARVAVEQASAHLVGAIGERDMAQQTLSMLIGSDSLFVHPITPMFLPDSLPSWQAITTAIHNNKTLKIIDIEENTARQNMHIEQSNLLPQIALLGHHRLWSSGVNEALLPATFVGIGASWTLFNGLGRKGSIARARSAVISAEIAYNQAHSQLTLAANKILKTIAAAMSEVEALTTAERLTNELVRARRKAFAEGMATSAEVVDAEVEKAEIGVAKLATYYIIDTSLARLHELCGATEGYLQLIESSNQTQQMYEK